MTTFDKDIAVRNFEENRLSKEGDAVARYWLSLWRDGELPRRADFQPRYLAPHLRAIAIFDVVPDVSVHCRLMGSGLAEGLRRDITGQDWLALTKPEDRPMRLERWSSVARGAIGRGLRAGRRESGEPQYSEELMLPFGGASDSGAYQVLFHVAWRQSTFDPTRVGITEGGALSVEFRLTPLAA